MDSESLVPRPSRGEAMAIGLALLAILIAAYFIFRSFGPSAPAVSPNRPAADTRANPAPAGTDIGTEIYQKSANPISGKLPQTVAPVPNPIQSVYKNPFQ